MCALWPERDLDAGVVHGCEGTKTQEVGIAAHSCMGVLVWFHRDSLSGFN